MARVQVDLPDRFPFSTEVQVYISHINFGGHLDHVRLLSLVAEARGRFFAALGYPPTNVHATNCIVGDQVVQYKGEALYGDVLRVEMAPADFNKYGFDLVYRVTEKVSGKEIARGKIGLIALDERRERPAPPAPALLEKLQNL